MRLSIAFLTLLVAVSQARPIPSNHRAPNGSLQARQFGDFLSGVGDFFGIGDSDDAADSGESSPGGKVLGAIGDAIGFGGNDDADADSGEKSTGSKVLGAIGNAIGLGGNDDTDADAGEKSTGNKVLGAIGDAIGLGGNNDADADDAGGNGGILDTVGGLFGLGNDDDDNAGAAAPAPAPAPATPPVDDEVDPAPATPPIDEADPADAPPAPEVDADAQPAQCSSSLPNINSATVNLIQSFEGFVASPEPDPIGLPTVGFGHLCQRAGCSEVTNQGFTFPLSRTDAVQLLQTDVAKFTSCLARAVDDSVTLNENQFGALTSFTFNLGCGTLQKSTLLRRLNAGENPNTVAAQELPKFRKAGGKILAGLVRRRAAEVDLFQTPSNTVALPVCN